MIFNNKEEFQDWLDHMEEALDAWFKRLPQEMRDKLDFSIDSLDALEGWLLDRYPSFDAAMAESESLIFDSAARYIGETFIRNIGGHWDIELEDPKYVYYGLPQITGYIERPTPLCPRSMATASVDRRRGDFISSVFRSYKADLEGEPPGEHTNDSRQQGSAAGAIGRSSPLTGLSPDDSDRVKDTYTSFIMFHRSGFTLEDAADALAKSSLTVESRSDHLLGDYLLVRRNPGETPVLRVYLSRSPHVQEEAAEIGEGTPYADAVARCDARFEIDFDDLDEVLDELYFLVATQETLHEATQAPFMFNCWNLELVDLQPAPPRRGRRLSRPRGDGGTDGGTERTF